MFGVFPLTVMLLRFIDVVLVYFSSLLSSISVHWYSMSYPADGSWGISSCAVANTAATEFLYKAFSRQMFSFTWINTQEQKFWDIGKMYVSLKMSYGFLKCLYHLTLHSVKVWSFNTSLSTFCIVRHFILVFLVPCSVCHCDICISVTTNDVELLSYVLNG